MPRVSGSLRRLGAGLLLALPTALFAQTGLTDAAIEGTVRDGSGQPLRGAAVATFDDASGFARTTTTDAEGRYRFAALPLGAYRLRFEHAGFQTLVRSGLAPRVREVLVV